jgi:D-glycero-D-manno-heptose 1,7-bisphosphate phosphatase
MHPKLVILDRDGTINRASEEFIKSAEEWEPLPGALEAIGRLNHAGYQVVVATNQSGLGRGLFDMAALNSVHSRMVRTLTAVGGRIDGIFYCPHAPDDECGCRKPAAGLLTQIAERWGVSLLGVPLIGDSLRDMQAGALVGCSLHLVCTGRHPQMLHEPLPAVFPAGTQVHADLAACVDQLLAAEPAA